MLKVNDLLSINDTASKIKSIKTRVKTLDADIHLAACSALKHYAECGNLTLLSNLVKATTTYNAATGKFSGRSVRGADLRAWIREHANVSWHKTADNNNGGYKKDKDHVPKYDLEHALENSPFAAREAVSQQYIDAEQRIKSMAKSFKTMMQNTNEGLADKTRIREDQMALVSTFINTVDALFDDKKAIIVEEEQPLAADANMVEILENMVNEEKKEADKVTKAA